MLLLPSLKETSPFLHRHAHLLFVPVENNPTISRLRKLLELADVFLSDREMPIGIWTSDDSDPKCELQTTLPACVVRLLGEGAHVLGEFRRLF